MSPFGRWRRASFRVISRGLLCAVGVAGLAHLPVRVEAQSLADRVAAVGDGFVRLSFAARSGVCGNGRNIMTTDDRDRHWESNCETGPVRVVLQVRDGRPTDVDTYVGGRWRAADDEVTDLGLVSASEAAAFLISMAESEQGEIGKEAIFPATLADSASLWPRLLAIARNPSRPATLRRRATFWLARDAGHAVASQLEAMATDSDDDIEVRKHAVFVLSRLPDGRGVAALLRIARTHRDIRIRKQALFWLGRSDDPRVLDLFEELLIEDG